MGFPGGTSGKEPTCQCPRHEMRFPSLSQEDALEEGMATHSSILSWRIPWTEEPGSYSPWGRKGSDMTERLTHTHIPNNGFPGGAVVKNLPANAGDAREGGSIPGSEKSPGGGNGNPVQYSCLENPTDRGPQRVGHDCSDLACMRHV